MLKCKTEFVHPITWAEKLWFFSPTWFPIGPLKPVFLYLYFQCSQEYQRTDIHSVVIPYTNKKKKEHEAFGIFSSEDQRWSVSGKDTTRILRVTGSSARLLPDTDTAPSHHALSCWLMHRCNMLSKYVDRPSSSDRNLFYCLSSDCNPTRWNCMCLFAPNTQII